MSEQAKVAFLQEQIKDARGHARNGFIICLVGAVVASSGFASYANGMFGGGFALLVLGIVGVAAAIVGLSLGTYNEIKRIRWMNALGKIAFPIPKCPKCGKEFPRGNLEFCPFCGNSLKTLK